MDAWSLMCGDAFIHFVCGSRRVNIRLGVLLLIPKSPQTYGLFFSYYALNVSNSITLYIYIYVDMKVGLTAAPNRRGFVCVWRAGQ